MNSQALLIVDVQIDFCRGGALVVPQGDRVVAALNQYIAYFRYKGRTIMASRDWHPINSKHFKTHGGLWPEHCLQNTRGADFHPKLKLPQETVILSKGMDENKNGYSVFEAQTPAGEPFKDVLKRLHIDTLFVGGLATEFCVQSTVLDALQQGWQVELLTDAIQGIGPAACRAAMDMMLMEGAHPMTLMGLKQQEKQHV
ncbi:MAG: isochorismatase family protein [Candidatus Omnitrophica bacterium]|nr:isochorismatase family protein [Candidatus Omnitrophota bacterium]MDE2221440.1 isochorismatase family protein [Candidatus Omnitrophota bacterium]